MGDPVETFTPKVETLKMLDVLARLEVLIEHHMVPARGYLSLKETAIFLGTSPSTLREWIRTRRLPHYKPGKELLFKRTELDSWMDRHRTVVGPLALTRR